MKSILLSLIALSELCFAGGSGSGTLSQLKGFSRLQSSKSPIIFYQGENASDVFIQYGINQGSQWKIDAFKINKQKHDINQSVKDAILKSKQSKDWYPILNDGFSNKSSSK